MAGADIELQIFMTEFVSVVGAEGVGVEPTNPARIAILQIARLTDAQPLRSSFH